MDKDWVFAELTRRGVVRAEVAYSGGNDSGGVDSIEFYDAAGARSVFESVFAPAAWNPVTGDMELTRPETSDERLSRELEEPVEAKWGSFAGEFYVSGRVVVDVPNRTVKVGEDVDYANTEHEEYDY